jgi:hypothetical protein
MPMTNMMARASGKDPTNAEVSPNAATDSPLITPPPMISHPLDPTLLHELNHSVVSNAATPPTLINRP